MLAALWTAGVLPCGATSAAMPPPTMSVVSNGSFEAADPEDPAQPAGWDKPDGLGVQWVAAPTDDGDAEPRGKAIRIDTRVSEKDMVQQWKTAGITKWDIPNPAANEVAATYGLSYYSDAIPVNTGHMYRLTFDFRRDGRGEGAKVWVRAYGMFHGRMRRRYETLVSCNGDGSGWQRFSHTFDPARRRPDVTEMKVMLFAYWPPGIYWFDNVRLEPVPRDAVE